MKMLSISTVAKLEGISRQCLHRHCKNGHVKGATKDDIGRWHINENYVLKALPTGRPPQSPIPR